MANYLLPCSCGRQVSVSASMAGQQVQCECGNGLEVPTLRELGKLPRDERMGSPAPRPLWTDRQRVAFAFVVVGLGAGALAGFLIARMPPAPQLVVQEINEAAVQASSPDQIHSAFEQLKKGIKPTSNLITPEARDALEQRKIMAWGVRIVLALGACALVAAGATMATRGKPVR